MKISHKAKFLGAMSALMLVPTLASAAFINSSSFHTPSIPRRGITGVSTDINYTVIKGNSPGVVNGILRWTKNNVYILDSKTFIDAGVTLIIEPGTLIRGEEPTIPVGSVSPTNPADVGALIAMRGGKIIANGTAQEPIIMTSLEDPYVPGGASTIPTDSQMDPENPGIQALPGRNYSLTGPSGNGNNAIGTDGQWGGLVILGNGVNSYRTSAGSFLDPTFNPFVDGRGATVFEGITVLPEAVYGGLDDNDNSGVYRFISLRYGGYILSTNREINSYTMGSTGRGTTMEFLESFNNADDDFEYFGGTVNGKYLAALFSGDDGVDTDQGYRGALQYVFHIQNNTGTRNNGVASGRLQANIGDNLGELDGPESLNTGLPFSVFRLYNGTFIGTGNNTTAPGSNFAGVGQWRMGSNAKDNAGAKFYNSIITESLSGGVCIAGNNTPGDLSTPPATDNNTPLARYLFTRTTGGEYNLAGVSAPATEPDLVYKNNMFWNVRTSVQTSPAAAATGVYNGAAETISDVAPPVAGSSGNLAGRTSGTADVNNSSIHTSLAANNTIGVNPQLVSIGRTDTSALNPRLAAGSPARTGGLNPSLDSQFGATGATQAGYLSTNTFRGAFKDNYWLKGWSILDALNVNSTTDNVAEPILTLGRSGANPSVAYTTVNGVTYSVEKSTDGGKNFSPLITQTGTGATVTHVDTTTVLTVGTQVLYRVIPQ